MPRVVHEEESTSRLEAIDTRESRSLLVKLALKGHYQPSEQFLSMLLARTNQGFQNAEAEFSAIEDKAKRHTFCIRWKEFNFEVDSLDDYPREVFEPRRSTPI